MRASWTTPKTGAGAAWERCSWERGPPGSDVLPTAEERGPRAWAPGSAAAPGSAGILPAPGRRPARRRQERHARAGYSPARGAQCRRGRPWVHCRGLALEQPESVGVARLPMRRASGPLAGGTPALPGGPGRDVLGARASGPHRAEGPQSADRSDTPEPATPPPEAPNAVEAGLGCTAEDWRWSSPRAWASPACPCGGPKARKALIPTAVRGRVHGALPRFRIVARAGFAPAGRDSQARNSGQTAGGSIYRVRLASNV